MTFIASLGVARCRWQRQRKQFGYDRVITRRFPTGFTCSLVRCKINKVCRHALAHVCSHQITNRNQNAPIEQT
jgi:hypothetical protein